VFGDRPTLGQQLERAKGHEVPFPGKGYNLLIRSQSRHSSTPTEQVESKCNAPEWSWEILVRISTLTSTILPL
jgi:hypothetical protein